MTHPTASASPDTTSPAAPPGTTCTVLLALPDYLRAPSTPDDELYFAVRTRAASAEAATVRAAGYLLFHFDTDYADRAAAETAAHTVECIGVAEGEITFTADRPMTLTAD